MVRNTALNRELQIINRLIKDTALFAENKLELQGHWGKYLCILVADFLENAISYIYIEFVSNSASPHVVQYSLHHLNRIQNPKSNRFVDVARLFKKEWGDELESFFKENEKCKGAIDSIMNSRNLIAHGRQTSISVNQVQEYLNNSLIVIEYIEKQCGIQ